eukprot:gb/GECG01013662.1/.p1 GENE.gb/GECG01013662.1/~~gb/GECG01013662.1/.p1  ORF type:complete len:398 (+),score=67.11 gb/GECG01013662.1/:1-1194(+)
MFVDHFLSGIFGQYSTSSFRRTSTIAPCRTTTMRTFHVILFCVLHGLMVTFAGAIEGADICHMCLFQPQCLELAPEDAKNGLVSTSFSFDDIEHLDDVCSCISNVESCLKDNSCGYGSQVNSLKSELGCGDGNSINYMCLLCTYQAFQSECRDILPENMDLNSTSDVLTFAKQVFSNKGEQVCSCVKSIDDCRKQPCSFETPKDLDSFLGRAGCSNEDEKSNDDAKNGDEERGSDDERQNNDEEQKSEDDKQGNDGEQRSDNEKQEQDENDSQEGDGNGKRDDNEEKKEYDEEKQENDDNQGKEKDNGKHDDGEQDDEGAESGDETASAENDGASVPTKEVVTPIVGVVAAGAIIGGIVLATWVRRRRTNTTITTNNASRDIREWRYARQAGSGVAY